MGNWSTQLVLLVNGGGHLGGCRDGQAIGSEPSARGWTGTGEEDGPRDEVAYDAKLDALAKVIRTIDPDVLAVQEVGNPEALADLAERTGDGWLRETAPVEEGQRPIRVGYLSRLPMTDVEAITAFPPGLDPIQVADDGPSASAMGRAALRARIDVGGRPVD